ncbi:MAG TPA: hypothetical protein VLT45_02490 [Kofleriaceae bacterium]|nr:hypothetical protein [Kofleriaceae bacterium]
MTAFKFDITNAPFTKLLLMFHDMAADNGAFRSHLSREYQRESGGSISDACNELRAEIDRRFPAPGRGTTGRVLPGFERVNFARGEVSARRVLQDYFDRTARQIADHYNEQEGVSAELLEGLARYKRQLDGLPEDPPPPDLVDRVIFAVLNTLDQPDAWGASRRDPESFRAAVRLALKES